MTAGINAKALGEVDPRVDPDVRARAADNARRMFEQGARERKEFSFEDLGQKP